MNNETILKIQEQLQAQTQKEGGTFPVGLTIIQRMVHDFTYIERDIEQMENEIASQTKRIQNTKRENEQRRQEQERYLQSIRLLYEAAKDEFNLEDLPPIDVKKPTIPYMDIEEFHEIGLLQEVNRQFFHPMGLALEVNTNEEGKKFISGIWDYRDDPKGMLFDECKTQEQYRERREKADNVDKMLWAKAETRYKMFGGESFQPIMPPKENNHE